MKTIRFIGLAALLTIGATDTVTIPGVSRLYVYQAEAILQDKGLVGIPVEVFGPVCGYKVVGTNPKYGTVVEVGSEVEILYSSGTQTTYCEEHGLQVNHP